MADLFGRYDVLIFPGENFTAFRTDYDFSEAEWSDPAGAAGNLCGLPAISVPCGFGDDGLPVSLAAMSGAFEDSKAIALARFYQGITSWHEKRPPLTRAS
jgi:aspartyl-tRNA(Asn)/glutamyl-tRNA(Gln) amidotransferase subunit A